MLADFTNRRNNILADFRKAKSDLEQLNKDIDVEIKQNAEVIAKLTAEQTNLKSIKSSNTNSIKGLNSFIGK